MTSGFEAPNGPAASVPPPPPPAGTVPPAPRPTPAPAPQSPPPPPPPPPPAAAPAPTAPAPAAPAPAAPQPPPAPRQTPAPAAPAPSPPAPAAPQPPAPAVVTPPPAEPKPPVTAPVAAEPAPVPAPAPAPAPAEPPAPERVDEPERLAADRHDLSDLLDQITDDLGLEPDAAVVPTEAPLTDPRDLERPVTETIVIESTGGLAYRPVFASFSSRLKGALIDGLALSIAMVPGALVILQTSGGMNTMIGLILLALGFAAATVSYARSVSRTGQWFGNKVANTKVVNAINGANLDMGYAGARFAARHLVSVIFLFGFVVGLTDSQRRTFHDRLAGSIVVGRPRATWSAEDDDA